MKTPRDLLFERHSQAEPKLDAIRQNALATLAEAPNSTRLKESRADTGVERFSRVLNRPRVGAPTLLRRVWLGLIWPSRHAWAGMAVLWVAVLAANLEMKVTSLTVPSLRPAQSPDWVRAVEEQRRLLAELLPPAKPPAVQPRQPNPRPRSEWRPPLKTC